MGTLLRQRPCVPLVMLFAGGIVVSRLANLELRTGVLLGCAGLLGCLIPRLRWGALAFLIFVAGAALYAARYEILAEGDLRLVAGEKSALAAIRGRLVESPAVREFPGKSNQVEYSYARVEVTEIHFEKQWRPAHGQVATITRGVLGPEIFKGRRVEVEGVIAPPNGAQAPGLFDFRRHLYNTRIFYQLRCESTNDWRLVSQERMPVAERFQRWAHGQLARGLPAEDEPLAMVRAMALGANQSLSGEVAEVFMKTGTLHIFAISGLHVACIAACILTGLRLAGVPRDRAALVLIPLVWFYTLATGWQSSAVRSALMSTFVFAGWAIRRPTELLNSTAAAALLILGFEPEQLFQASFQLSFVVVAAIAVILEPMDREQPRWPVQLQNRLLRYDPLLPPELRPAWKRWVEIPAGFLLANFAISWAAWIGSSPLTAYYFNMVTPISLVANLVAVPLSSVSLAATLGSLLIPPLGPVFNYLSWATMWETIQVTRGLAAFSWGYFYVPKPDLGFFLVYWAVVVVWVIPRLRRPGVRRYAWGTVAALGLVWLGCWGWKRQATVLTVLAAPGNPIFADLPGRGEDMLIDCSNAANAERLLKRFLHGRGVGAIRNLVLTQGDVDHAGGFATVQEEFRPRAVFASLVAGRSRPYREVLTRLEKWPGARRVRRGDEVERWRVLHPPEGKGLARAEDNAVVLQGEVAGWRVLLLGVLGPAGQQALLESGADLGAEILVTGEGVREDLIERIGARMVVVQAFDKPFSRGRAAKKEVPASAAWVVSTRAEGTIEVEISKRECAMRTGAGRTFVFEKNR